MSETSQATPHYPSFITLPGETDTMLIGVIIFLVLITLGIGVFYLKLHSLPEKMAHQTNHGQMQLVAILGLLGLFTHNNLFWISALLLAAFKLPDYAGMLGSISTSLERLAGRAEIIPPPARPPEPDMPETDTEAKAGN